MTNEEAINVLEDYDINFERHTAEAIAEAHEMAIKALEEQPCEDCISRKLMHDMGATCIAARNKDGDLVALGALDILPSATPQQKTGHWIWCASSHKCSNCGGYVCFSHKKLLKYCPNCGAKMEEAKE